jgi:hypothetical protein
MLIYSKKPPLHYKERPQRQNPLSPLPTPPHTYITSHHTISSALYPSHTSHENYHRKITYNTLKTSQPSLPHRTQNVHSNHHATPPGSLLPHPHHPLCPAKVSHSRDPRRRLHVPATQLQRFQRRVRMARSQRHVLQLLHQPKYVELDRAGRGRVLHVLRR